MSFAEITSCPSSRSIQSYNDLLLIKVDVVLVDKSPSHGPFSHVYQLPEQLFKPSVNLFELRHSLHEKRHNFIFLGESSHISKSAKKIFLCNGTIISYHYFIEIIGIDHPLPANSEDLLPGLEHLEEALRIQSSIKFPRFPISQKVSWNHNTEKQSASSSFPSPKYFSSYRNNASRLTCGKRFRVEV